MGYRDRQDAGQRLAHVLRPYADQKTVVLALPRGGIVLGAEVAKELRAPLDLVLVRKLSHPMSPEYAIGAVVEGSDPILNRPEADSIDKDWLKQAENSARELLAKRRKLYFGGSWVTPSLKDKVVILVDDGIATGLTMEACVIAVKKQRPERIVVAVPVAPKDSVERLEELADEVVVLDDPDEFLGAVGSHYQHFDQVDDEEVKAILHEARADLPPDKLP